MIKIYSGGGGRVRRNLEQVAAVMCAMRGPNEQAAWEQAAGQPLRRGLSPRVVWSAD